MSTFSYRPDPPEATLEAQGARTENDTIAELARRAAGRAEPLELGGYYIVHDGNGGTTTHDLTGDRWRDHPRRIRETVQLTHIDSLLDYWGKHAHPESEMWANPNKRTLTAIIDAHGPAILGEGPDPDWQAHRAHLELHLSDPLNAWIANNDKPLTQEAFGEFLEEQMPYITNPAGADLMEMVHTLEIVQHAEFKSGIRLKTGARVMQFLETVDGRTKDNRVEIPDQLTLRLPIWRGDTDTHELTARFRYRANIPRPGSVALLYKLNSLRELLDGAFAITISTIAEQIGRPVYRGTPAPPHE